MLDHAADLRQEVLSDDAVQVPVLRRGFVLEALSQAGPLLLSVTNQRPGSTLVLCNKMRSQHSFLRRLTLSKADDNSMSFYKRQNQSDKSLDHQNILINVNHTSDTNQ